MSEDILAQKGQAAPAASHPGGESRFHNRRTIVLPALSMGPAANRPADAVPARPKPPAGAARLTGPAAEKRKFTFRIDPVRHAAFCRAAEARDISRQKFLTEALDAMLQRQETREPATGDEPSGAATLLPENVAALPPPL